MSNILPPLPFFYRGLTPEQYDEVRKKRSETARASWARRKGLPIDVLEALRAESLALKQERDRRRAYREGKGTPLENIEREKEKIQQRLHELQRQERDSVQKRIKELQAQIKELQHRLKELPQE